MKKRLENYKILIWLYVIVRYVEWIEIVKFIKRKRKGDFFWKFVKIMIVVVINYYFGGFVFNLLMYKLGFNVKVL